MTNIEKYDDAFMEVFARTREHFNNKFTNKTVDEWDSVRQLNLVVSIEDTFDIMFDTEDIMEFNSYEGGKEIMLRYDISL